MFAKPTERHTGIKFFKRCGIRRPTDMVGIKKCVTEAVQEGIMPTKIFIEKIPHDPTHVAVLYEVPKDQLVKEFLEREENMGLMIEDVIDDFYDFLGDEFVSEELVERRKLEQWAKKIIW